MTGKFTRSSRRRKAASGPWLGLERVLPSEGYPNSPWRKKMRSEICLEAMSQSADAAMRAGSVALVVLGADGRGDRKWCDSMHRNQVQKCRGGADAHFSHDIAAMNFHRFRRDRQIACDLLGHVAGRDKIQDLLFARSERLRQGRHHRPLGT